MLTQIKGLDVDEGARACSSVLPIAQPVRAAFTVESAFGLAGMPFRSSNHSLGGVRVALEGV